MKTIVLNVEMACAGCSNAVIRLLKKVEGVNVENIVADVDSNKVTVECEDNVTSEELLGAITKWATAGGKAISLDSE